MLQVSAGTCPDCGDNLWVGSKILNHASKSVMVLTCHKCDFYWPASTDTFYDELWDRTETPKELIHRRLENIRSEMMGLFWKHRGLKSIRIIAKKLPGIGMSKIIVSTVPDVRPKKMGKKK